MIIENVTQQKKVSDDVKVAKNFFQRLKGLLGTKELRDNQGLWIPKCQGIHMFGMAFAIDALFLDKENRIIGMTKDLPPNKVGPTFLKAKSVLELPAGKIEREKICLGDQLAFLDN